MKFWDLVRTANANLWHNKLRTILTIVAIFVGGFVVTLMVGVNAGVNDYIGKQIGAIGGKDLLMVAKAQDKSANANDKNAGPEKYDPEKASMSGTMGSAISLLNDSDIAKMRAVKNVARVQPSIYVTAEWLARSADSQKYVVEVDPVIPGITPNLAAGRLPRDGSANEIAILTSTVKAFGFKNYSDAVGKTLLVGVKNPTNQQIEPITAKVVGVQNTTLVSSGGANANSALLEKMDSVAKAGFPPNLKNRYVGAFATMHSDLSEHQISGIKSSFKRMGYRGLTVADAAGIVQDVVNAVSIALVGFGAIALLAASFGIINTLFMSVQERTKEIGLMKAMGMSRAKVFMLFALEALLIGFWGSLVSVLAAIGVGNAINHVAEATFLKGLEGFTLMKFDFPGVALVVLVVMLIAFLSGTLPARRASRKDPIDALRYE